MTKWLGLVWLSLPFSVAATNSPRQSAVPGGVMIIICYFFLTITGCSLSNWDRRENVAFATLVNESGQFHMDAYSAAIIARFPIGSSAEKFMDYVEMTKGTCIDKSNSRLWCEIPTKGELCWAEIIGVEVGIESGVIKSFIFDISSLGC